MSKLRNVLEEEGLSEDRIDEIIGSVTIDNLVAEPPFTPEEMDSLIDAEDDPLKKAKLVARKISRKLDNAEY